MKSNFSQIYARSDDYLDNEAANNQSQTPVKLVQFTPLKDTR